MCSRIKRDGMRISSTQVKMRRNLGQIIGRMGEIAYKVEREVLIVFVSMIVVIVFFGVIVRYTPITGQTIWTAELGRLFLLWAAFWAAGSIERVNGHFRFEMVEALLSGKPRFFLQLFIKLVLLISMGILIWWTIIYSGEARGVTTRILQWPEIIRRLSLLLGSLLLFAHCLTGFIRSFRRLFEKCY